PGSDIVALQEARDDAVAAWRQARTEWNELNQKQGDYEEALGVIRRYQGSLASASGGSTAVTAALREIQSGLLQQDIDTEDLANQARNIFEELQAAQTGSGAGDATYTDLLDGMDEMIRDIQAYAELKSSEETLDEQTEELSNASDWSGEDWKEVWTEKLDALKSAIGTLPAYSGTENSLLRNYDRTEAMDHLDDLSRLYIAEHNAVDQAGIYLRSPNRGLALFSWQWPSSWILQPRRVFDLSGGGEKQEGTVASRIEHPERPGGCSGGYRLRNRLPGHRAAVPVSDRGLHTGERALLLQSPGW
ncbi:MAG: hypothetical protein ACLRIS_18805, partial [Flavonifractor plautii]